MILNLMKRVIFKRYKSFLGSSGNKLARVAFIREKVRKMSNSELVMGLALILCDTIIEDSVTGKKSLIGLFSQIHAPKLPCVHQSMNILVSVTGGQGTYPCQIVCEHPELERPVFGLDCTLKFENPFQVVDLVFQLKAVRFPLPGKYEIKVIIDGVPELIRPLIVSVRKDMAQKSPEQREEK